MTTPDRPAPTQIGTRASDDDDGTARERRIWDGVWSAAFFSRPAVDLRV